RLGLHSFPTRRSSDLDVEEAVLEVGVARLRLRHDERVVLLRDLAEGLGLLAGNVDGALARERRVVEVEDLIVEGLQRALGKSDQDRKSTRLNSSHEWI